MPSDDQSSEPPPSEDRRSAPRDGAVRESSGWIASLLVHGALLAALAAASFPPPPGLSLPSLVAEPVGGEAIEEVLLPAELELDLASDSVMPALEAAVEPSELDAAAGLEASAALAVADAASFSPTAMVAPIGGSAAALGEGVAGRNAASRSSLVEAKGGSRASEVAVARGLKWIAEHQNPDGSWSLLHSGGACRGRCGNDAVISKPPRPQRDFERSLRSGTALALLPMLGAGETHRSGRYRRVVERGLAALIRMGKGEDDSPGASWMDSGRMYAHGLAAIALTEAYGMTGDPALRGPAQAAVDFVAFAQDPDGGGWRYTPQSVGDVSVTGWQIMALKSGALAELRTSRRVADRAARFLDAAQTSRGARYVYMAPDEGAEARGATPTRTAVGLLCRMYLGWAKDDPRLLEGLAWIAERGPTEGNYYHNYYAAQALFHQTGGEGPVWRAWNEPMREQLIAQQATRGHERGSWWVEGPHNKRGGRLYTTALATMTLEVYYRYLPLYQADAVDSDFPD